MYSPSTSDRSESSIDHRGFFPASLDDPATQVAYNFGVAIDWLKSRNCLLLPPASVVGYPYAHEVPIPVQATVNSLLSYQFPTWQKSLEYYNIWSSNEILSESHKIIFHQLMLEYDIPPTDPGNPSLVIEPVESCDSGFLNHVLRSLDFSARIQMRYSSGPERWYPAATWSVPYNSFFEYAWEDILQPGPVNISYSPKWALHREHDSQPAPWEVSHIVPDVAFNTNVLSFLSEPAFDNWSDEQLEEALTELTTAYDTPSALWATHSFAVPFFIVEYVKSRKQVNGRSEHHAHLAMAMTSVLGLYKTLEIPLPVLGLLVDRYEATLVVTWSRHHVDFCGLLPFNLGKFDLCSPYDALRLRFVLCNLKSHAARLRDLAKQSRSRVIAAFLSGEYYRWRQQELPDRTPTPIESPQIEEWRNNV